MTAFYTLVMVSYLLILLALLRGWNKALASPVSAACPEKFLSVLVPFRNEAGNVNNLIDSLKGLNYPSNKFEVILIDDHSEDNSVDIVRARISDFSNCYQIELPNGREGKKEGLTLGVSRAQGEIIVTTDADCTLAKDWLRGINCAFQYEDVKMVFGGVRLETGGTFFSSLQALEFTSLLGSGVATLTFGLFTMCNGANLAFRKTAFKHVKGYEGNFEIPSGDDEFLARKILDEFPESLRFLNRKGEVVSTQPSNSLRDFFHQRIRWAGKWRYGTNRISMLFALYILLVQITTTILVGALIFHTVNLGLAVTLIASKILLEFLFLRSVSGFLDSRWDWAAFVVLQFIYPPYVIAVGIVSLSASHDWKGRRLSHKM